MSAAAAVYAIVPEPWFGLAHPAMFALSWQPRPLTRPRSGPGPNLGLTGHFGNVGTALVFYQALQLAFSLYGFAPLNLSIPVPSCQLKKDGEIVD